MQKFQNKFKKKKKSGISKSRVGILLYSKIEKKKKKKKNLFLDFQNQGWSDVDNQTIFFFWPKSTCSTPQNRVLGAIHLLHKSHNYTLMGGATLTRSLTALIHKYQWQYGICTKGLLVHLLDCLELRMTALMYNYNF